MTAIIAALIVGLALLVWGASRFVDAAANLARLFGMAPLLVGIVVVGFGTSTPEILVSALSAAEGNSGIALGNAYGSNIVNISLILGLAAIINPVPVAASVIRRELPLLAGATLLSALLLWDREVTRLDALILLAAFAVTLYFSIKGGIAEHAVEAPAAVQTTDTPTAGAGGSKGRALIWAAVGLVVMMAASRLFVWGAVELAKAIGVSDLLIGLTIVSIGTSLPELASSVIAARKGEHDLALGNILGSNTFNALVVVGVAGMISPMQAAPEIMLRDFPVMGLFTASVYVFCRTSRLISRLEGIVLCLAYAAYTAYLAYGAMAG